MFQKSPKNLACDTLVLFKVLTQGSKYAEYDGAEESAIKTQLTTNESTRRGAMALLLDKTELSRKVLFTMLSVSEQ